MACTEFIQLLRHCFDADQKKSAVTGKQKIDTTHSWLCVIAFLLLVVLMHGFAKHCCWLIQSLLSMLDLVHLFIVLSPYEELALRHPVVVPLFILFAFLSGSILFPAYTPEYNLPTISPLRWLRRGYRRLSLETEPIF